MKLTNHSVLIKYCFFILFVFSGTFIKAQNHELRFSNIDILHYRFEISLNDSTNYIEGKAMISARLKKQTDSFHLDFDVNMAPDKAGMEIIELLLNGEEYNFSAGETRIILKIPPDTEPGDKLEFTISYRGIPKDGLIISKNKFGERTFFADNWPNRARFWLPVVDHPSDKATCEFLVKAPLHYLVVSNGIKAEESMISPNYKLTHWKETVPIPTKVMVIGVARFSVNYNESNSQVPVSTWVFRQNRDEGFKDYSAANGPLKFYSEKIGPYAYEKLANVQSKTRFGGMENAGCIFYNERTVNGKGENQRLFAHEIAHQWFGNSVTEQNWHHLWLSEGFATYLTNLYTEYSSGKDTFIAQMKADRERVVEYTKRNLSAVIDTSVTDYIRLLNPNSYQKAAWVLHMLRIKVGDKIFWEGLRKYYHTYKDSTALTANFQSIMQEVYDKPLDDFFHQWLYKPGIPVLEVTQTRTGKRRIEITVRQAQGQYIFSFPLDLKIVLQSGKTKNKTLRINGKEHSFVIKTSQVPSHIIPDPDCHLLFEQLSD